MIADNEKIMNDIVNEFVVMVMSSWSLGFQFSLLTQTGNTIVYLSCSWINFKDIEKSKSYKEIKKPDVYRSDGDMVIWMPREWTCTILFSDITSDLDFYATFELLLLYLWETDMNGFSSMYVVVDKNR